MFKWYSKGLTALDADTKDTNLIFYEKISICVRSGYLIEKHVKEM